ncbi:hypothetical protein Acy02nite_04560 [Actinoplanes cyaneus]|uniref:Lipoprotein n=1 Tax=Actinoplanes cyaneus TaxID=52696 RepID=A0A919IIK6_9ACTN|nr:hypothetical protein [Actinoplanes cyaneus]MCW2136057.1 hypothetical protein [Actinoplanes cyaneus]GID62575.1 hypothetical protein Acy02nite_04560 [Actinoplanes cyaneus]
MTRTRGLLTAAVPLILMAGCARPGEAGSAAEPVTESAAATPAVLVRIAQEGGFVPANYAYGRLPDITVYADGRVISNGPVPMIHPGPALPNVLVAQITPARAQQWADDALKAGVKSGADLGTPGITDIPDTVITATSQGRTETVRVNALRQARPDDPNLTADQRAARKKLVAYADALTGFAAETGSPAPAAYRPVTLVALVEQYVPGDAKQEERAWPGPALPGEELNPGTGLHCVAVTGAAKDLVQAAAEKANQLTPWTSGGKQWRVTFRPLLPEETGGCAALKGAR